MSEIVERFSGVDCPYCRMPMGQTYWSQPTRDHVVPTSKGGDNTPTNIIVACRRCNGDKGGMHLSRWYGYLYATKDPRAKIVHDAIEKACGDDRALMSVFYSEAAIGGMMARRRKKNDHAAPVAHIQASAWAIMEQFKVPTSHWCFEHPRTVKVVVKSQIVSVRFIDPHRFADRIVELLGIEDRA
jgi:hypothetical protein